MNKHCFVVLAYKESPYLENCLQSVLNQSYKSNVIIATSTPNEYISEIASKYEIQIIESKEKGRGIGFDFDFARTCTDYDLVTIAHQDDQYDYDYAKSVIEEYELNPDSLILFTDYYEIKNQHKEYKNINLKIKKILLFSLKIKKISNYKLIKRNAIRFGCAICCPAVTFANKNIPHDSVFDSDMKCNIDWFAWEKLSQCKGRFVYISKSLMGHRIHEDSTTTKIIEDNSRSKEDLIMFKKFWPNYFAKIITKLYSNSEKGNKI